MKWTLIAIPLLLLLAACDQKPESKGHDHAMPAAPAAGADKAKDPICGMYVDKAKSTKHTYDGADYYFCADACLAKFKTAPQKYAPHCTCANVKRTCSCEHCGGKEPCDCTK